MGRQDSDSLSRTMDSACLLSKRWALALSKDLGRKLRHSRRRGWASAKVPFNSQEVEALEQLPSPSARSQDLEGSALNLMDSLFRDLDRIKLCLSLNNDLDLVMPLRASSRAPSRPPSPVLVEEPPGSVPLPQPEQVSERSLSGLSKALERLKADLDHNSSSVPRSRHSGPNRLWASASRRQASVRPSRNSVSRAVSARQPQVLGSVSLLQLDLEPILASERLSVSSRHKALVPRLPPRRLPSVHSQLLGPDLALPPSGRQPGSAPSLPPQLAQDSDLLSE